MRRAITRLAALWLALGWTGSALRAEVRVVDDLGHALVLAQPAQRIVVLAPNITEILFALGAGERIVGADQYSNYPEAAKSIPRISNHAAANYEQILALAPDLVIGWQSGNGRISGRIRELGLPMFQIEPRRLEDLPRLFLRLGMLTGLEPAARARSADFERRLRALRDTQRGKAPVRVFYQIWHEPLITLNGDHLVSDVLGLCGGVNVFADAAPLVPNVGIEAVLQANPEVIILGGSEDDGTAGVDWWQDWQAIEAVRHRRVYAIPPDLMQRHSERILDGAGLLCGILDEARR
jgi:iron complex transport system substrate-binding protein